MSRASMDSPTAAGPLAPPPTATSDAARGAAPRELSARALGVGVLVGSVLALGNLYMGLKMGLWDSGSITASVLSFGLLAALARLSGRRISCLETNIAQTTAVAVGAAPAAAGLIGALPALELLGRSTPAWLACAWGAVLGVSGVALALALRRRLLDEERLPFPTGVAVAQVIEGAHGGERSGTRALVGAGAAAAAFTTARDALGSVPAFLAWPGTVGGTPAAACGAGIGLSPMVMGAGLLVGAQNALGALLGGVVAWVGIAPALVRAGIVPSAGYAPFAGWLAWPGVALMLGSAAVSLVSQAGAFRGTARHLDEIRRDGPARGAVVTALVLAVVVLALGAGGFGLGPVQVLLGIAFAVPLAGVCARAAGQTDISPAGDVGAVAQATTVVLTQATGVAGVAAGSVTAGAAVQAGTSLWSLRAGKDLGASPRKQAVGLIVGAVVGSAIAVPAYMLLVRAHGGVVSEALPAPGALPWKAIAEALGSGGGVVPRGAAASATAAFVAGVLLEILARTRASRWVPSAGALGMGFLIPLHSSAALAFGALAGAAWRRVRPESAAVRVPQIAAGAIAGESLAGVAVAALAAAGLLR
jgi:uncharacterized oligopeptide transporter (OPT) family protein